MAEITTERLRLRRFRQEDLPAFIAYRCEPQVARYQSWDVPYSMADAVRFLESQRGLAFGERGQWFQWAIVDRKTKAVCGDCAVRVGSEQPATAELGITLMPSEQGKGLAREALAALLSVLFAQEGMHRVFAEADDRNRPVHRLFKGLGFRQEARLVEADWFKGEWSTLRIYAMLRREWAGRLS